MTLPAGRFLWVTCSDKNQMHGLDPQHPTEPHMFRTPSTTLTMRAAETAEACRERAINAMFRCTTTQMTQILEDREVVDKPPPVNVL